MNNLPTKKEEPKIFDMLEKKHGELTKACPKSIDRERAIRLVQNTLRKNQQLAEAASTNQLSFFGAVSYIHSLGLEVDGRHAHLLPFKSKRPPFIEVTPIIDYKGFVQIVLNSGHYSYVHADTICENDIFEYNIGQITIHKVDFRKDRGAPYAYYAIARPLSGPPVCRVMPKADVDKIRDKAPGRNADAWTNHYDEMAKKTVFKNLTKWLKVSPELVEAIQKDDEEYEVRFEAAKPVFDSEPLTIEYQEQAGDPIPETTPEAVTVEGGDK